MLWYTVFSKDSACYSRKLIFHTGITGQDPGFHARRAIHSYAMDLVMGVADPIVTLDNVCAYPYTESPPTTNSTEPPFTTTVPVKEPELYVGTYGNNGYGEVEVVYNESSNMLQLKYGILGLWDLYVVEEQVHTFRSVALQVIDNSIRVFNSQLLMYSLFSTYPYFSGKIGPAGSLKLKQKYWFFVNFVHKPEQEYTIIVCSKYSQFSLRPNVKHQGSYSRKYT